MGGCVHSKHLVSHSPVLATEVQVAAPAGNNGWEDSLIGKRAGSTLKRSQGGVPEQLQVLALTSPDDGVVATAPGTPHSSDESNAETTAHYSSSVHQSSGTGLSLLLPPPAWQQTEPDEPKSAVQTEVAEVVPFHSPVAPFANSKAAVPAAQEQVSPPPATDLVKPFTPPKQDEPLPMLSPLLSPKPSRLPPLKSPPRMPSLDATWSPGTIKLTRTNTMAPLLSSFKSKKTSNVEDFMVDNPLSKTMVVTRQDRKVARLSGVELEENLYGSISKFGSTKKSVNWGMQSIFEGNTPRTDSEWGSNVQSRQSEKPSEVSTPLRSPVADASSNTLVPQLADVGVQAVPMEEEWINQPEHEAEPSTTSSSQAMSDVTDKKAVAHVHTQTPDVIDLESTSASVQQDTSPTPEVEDKRIYIDRHAQWEAPPAKDAETQADEEVEETPISTFEQPASPVADSRLLQSALAESAAAHVAIKDLEAQLQAKESEFQELQKAAAARPTATDKTEQDDNAREQLLAAQHALEELQQEHASSQLMIEGLKQQLDHLQDELEAQRSAAQANENRALQLEQSLAESKEQHSRSSEAQRQLLQEQWQAKLQAAEQKLAQQQKESEVALKAAEAVMRSRLRDAEQKAQQQQQEAERIRERMEEDLKHKLRIALDKAKSVSRETKRLSEMKSKIDKDAQSRDTEVKELRASLKSAQGTADRYKSVVDVREREAQALREALAEASSRAESATSKIEKLKRKASGLSDALLEADMDRKSLRKSNEAVAAAAANAWGVQEQALRVELEAARAALTESKAESAALSLRLTSLQVQLSAGTPRHARLAVWDTQASDAALQQMDNSVDTQGAWDKLERDLAEREAQIIALTQELAKTRSSDVEVAAARLQAEEAEALATRKDAEVAELRRQLEQQLPRTPLSPLSPASQKKREERLAVYGEGKLVSSGDITPVHDAAASKVGDVAGLQAQLEEHAQRTRALMAQLLDEQQKTALERTKAGVLAQKVVEERKRAEDVKRLVDATGKQAGEQRAQIDLMRNRAEAAAQRTSALEQQLAEERKSYGELRKKSDGLHSQIADSTRKLEDEKRRLVDEKRAFEVVLKERDNDKQKLEDMKRKADDRATKAESKLLSAAKEAAEEKRRLEARVSQLEEHLKRFEDERRRSIEEHRRKTEDLRRQLDAATAANKEQTKAKAQQNRRKSEVGGKVDDVQQPAKQQPVEASTEGQNKVDNTAKQQDEQPEDFLEKQLGHLEFADSLKASMAALSKAFVEDKSSIKAAQTRLLSALVSVIQLPLEAYAAQVEDALQLLTTIICPTGANESDADGLAAAQQLAQDLYAVPILVRLIANCKFVALITPTGIPRGRSAKRLQAPARGCVAVLSACRLLQVCNRLGLWSPGSASKATSAALQSVLALVRHLVDQGKAEQVRALSANGVVDVAARLLSEAAWSGSTAADNTPSGISGFLTEMRALLAPAFSTVWPAVGDGLTAWCQAVCADLALATENPMVLGRLLQDILVPRTTGAPGEYMPELAPTIVCISVSLTYMVKNGDATAGAAQLLASLSGLLRLLLHTPHGMEPSAFPHLSVFTAILAAVKELEEASVPQAIAMRASGLILACISRILQAISDRSPKVVSAAQSAVVSINVVPQHVTDDTWLTLLPLLQLYHTLQKARSALLQAGNAMQVAAGCLLTNTTKSRTSSWSIVNASVSCMAACVLATGLQAHKASDVQLGSEQLLQALIPAMQTSAAVLKVKTDQIVSWVHCTFLEAASVLVATLCRQSPELVAVLQELAAMPILATTAAMFTSLDGDSETGFIGHDAAVLSLLPVLNALSGPNGTLLMEDSSSASKLAQPVLLALAQKGSASSNTVPHAAHLALTLARTLQLPVQAIHSACALLAELQATDTSTGWVLARTLAYLCIGASARPGAQDALAASEALIPAGEALLIMVQQPGLLEKDVKMVLDLITLITQGTSGLKDAVIQWLPQLLAVASATSEQIFSSVTTLATSAILGKQDAPVKAGGKSKKSKASVAQTSSELISIAAKSQQASPVRDVCLRVARGLFSPPAGSENSQSKEKPKLAELEAVGTVQDLVAIVTSEAAADMPAMQIQSLAVHLLHLALTESVAATLNTATDLILACIAMLHRVPSPAPLHQSQRPAVRSPSPSILSQTSIRSQDSRVSSPGLASPTSPGVVVGTLDYVTAAECVSLLSALAGNEGDVETMLRSNVFKGVFGLLASVTGGNAGDADALRAGTASLILAKQLLQSQKLRTLPLLLAPGRIRVLLEVYIWAPSACSAAVCDILEAVTPEYALQSLLETTTADIWHQAAAMRVPGSSVAAMPALLVQLLQKVCDKLLSDMRPERKASTTTATVGRLLDGPRSQAHVLVGSSVHGVPRAALEAAATTTGAGKGSLELLHSACQLVRSLAQIASQAGPMPAQGRGNFRRILPLLFGLIRAGWGGSLVRALPDDDLHLKCPAVVEPVLQQLCTTAVSCITAAGERPSQWPGLYSHGYFLLFLTMLTTSKAGAAKDSPVFALAMWLAQRDADDLRTFINKQVGAKANPVAMEYALVLQCLQELTPVATLLVLSRSLQGNWEQEFEVDEWRIIEQALSALRASTITQQTEGPTQLSLAFSASAGETDAARGASLILSLQSTNGPFKSSMRGRDSEQAAATAFWDSMLAFKIQLLRRVHAAADGKAKAAEQAWRELGLHHESSQLQCSLGFLVALLRMLPDSLYYGYGFFSELDMQAIVRLAHCMVYAFIATPALERNVRTDPRMAVALDLIGVLVKRNGARPLIPSDLLHLAPLSDVFTDEARVRTLLFADNKEQAKVDSPTPDQRATLVNVLRVRGPLPIEEISMTSCHYVFRRSPVLFDIQTKVALLHLEVPLQDPPDVLLVDRNNLFETAFTQFRQRKRSDLLRRWKLQFAGEEAIDLHGVRREFVTLMSREVLNPKHKLFVKTNEHTYFPSVDSSQNPMHLKHFEFVGRFMAKVLIEAELLDVRFARFVYKRLLGRRLSYHDIASIDPELYENQLCWIRDHDITDVIFQNFTVPGPGGVEVELCPGGAQKDVTNDNKEEYLDLLVEYKLTREIEPQLRALMKGFSDLCPIHNVQMFSDDEVELVVCGRPNVDIDDLKRNAVFKFGYDTDSTAVRLLWDVLKQNLSPEERGSFLQFVTGSSRVPLGGFASYSPPFTIQQVPDVSRLPSASTCFNLLKLPPYANGQVLKSKLLTAITEASEGFGFS